MATYNPPIFSAYTAFSEWIASGFDGNGYSPQGTFLSADIAQLELVIDNSDGVTLLMFISGFGPAAPEISIQAISSASGPASISATKIARERQPLSFNVTSMCDGSIGGTQSGGITAEVWWINGPAGTYTLNVEASGAISNLDCIGYEFLGCGNVLSPIDPASPNEGWPACDWTTQDNACTLVWFGVDGQNVVQATNDDPALNFPEQPGWTQLFSPGISFCQSSTLDPTTSAFVMLTANQAEAAGAPVGLTRQSTYMTNAGTIGNTPTILTGGSVGTVPPETYTVSQSPALSSQDIIDVPGTSFAGAVQAWTASTTNNYIYAGNVVQGGTTLLAQSGTSSITLLNDDVASGVLDTTGIQDIIISGTTYGAADSFFFENVGIPVAFSGTAGSGTSGGTFAFPMGQMGVGGNPSFASEVIFRNGATPTPGLPVIYGAEFQAVLPAVNIPWPNIVASVNTISTTAPTSGIVTVGSENGGIGILTALVGTSSGIEIVFLDFEGLWFLKNWARDWTE